MLDGLKNYWGELKQGEPGKRFQEQHRKKHRSGSSPWRKVLFIGGGILIIAAGIFFLPAPGPGWAVIFIGGALLAQESLPAAKVLDWIELRIRAVVQWALRLWQRAPAWLRAIYVLVALAITGAGLYGAYLLLF